MTRPITEPLPKAYNPTAIERQIYKFWEEGAFFAAKDKSVLLTVEGAKREMLGERLSAIRDADGDGFADLVVLSPGAAVDRKRGNGYVRLLSGKTGKAITFINPLIAK